MSVPCLGICPDREDSNQTPTNLVYVTKTTHTYILNIEKTTVEVGPTMWSLYVNKILTYHNNAGPLGGKI